MTRKQTNILIDDLGNARICDFGLSRFTFENGKSGMTSTSDHTGTVRYLAPEFFVYETKATIAGDIYALGCICLEVHPLLSE
jgi:serine/threonine protein kinase